MSTFSQTLLCKGLSIYFTAQEQSDLSQVMVLIMVKGKMFILYQRGCSGKEDV